MSHKFIPAFSSLPDIVYEVPFLAALTAFFGSVEAGDAALDEVFDEIAVNLSSLDEFDRV